MTQSGLTKVIAVLFFLQVEMINSFEMTIRCKRRHAKRTTELPEIPAKLLQWTFIK